MDQATTIILIAFVIIITINGVIMYTESTTEEPPLIVTKVPPPVAAPPAPPEGTTSLSKTPIQPVILTNPTVDAEPDAAPPVVSTPPSTNSQSSKCTMAASQACTACYHGNSAGSAIPDQLLWIQGIHGLAIFDVEQQSLPLGSGAGYNVGGYNGWPKMKKNKSANIVPEKCYTFDSSIDYIQPHYFKVGASCGPLIIISIPYGYRLALFKLTGYWDVNTACGTSSAPKVADLTLTRLDLGEHCSQPYVVPGGQYCAFKLISEIKSTAALDPVPKKSWMDDN